MESIDRRQFLSSGSLTAVGALAALQSLVPGGAGAQPAARAPLSGPQGLAALVPGAVDETGQYVLPPLPYPYDAVAEAIDAETMELHHSKHHAAYVKGLTEAEAKLAEERAKENPDFGLISHWSREATFHGGGHFLHSIFWDCMGPEEMGGQPGGALADAINRDFGSFKGMMAQFSAAAKKVEGSGWGILGYSIPAQKLVIHQAQNQQLLTQWVTIPLLCLDVWEHAYYLRYRNNRGAYVDAFPKVINWSRVARRFELLSGAAT